MNILDEYYESIKNNCRATFKVQGAFRTLVFDTSDVEGTISIAISQADNTNSLIIRAIKSVGTDMLEQCNEYNKHSGRIVAFMEKGNLLVTSYSLTDLSIDSINSAIAKLIVVNSGIRNN